MTYSTVPSAAGKGLHWLLRYARHCKVKLDPHPPEGNALKSCFTQAAWRFLYKIDRLLLHTHSAQSAPRL